SRFGAGKASTSRAPVSSMSRLTDQIHRPILVSALRTPLLSADAGVLRDLAPRCRVGFAAAVRALRPVRALGPVRAVRPLLPGRRLRRVGALRRGRPERTSVTPAPPAPLALRSGGCRRRRFMIM